MIFYPNILIVSGTGRNVGKTTFVCKLIQKFSVKSNIIAVKITPHFYDYEPDFLIKKNQNYIISEEKNNNSNKDSSLMLKYGASKVYFIQVLDKFLDRAFESLSKYIGETDIIICESARLRKVIKPGVFIVLTDEKNNDKNSDLILLANNIISYKKIDSEIERISFEDNRWILN